jgi:hypothetical protein
MFLQYWRFSKFLGLILKSLKMLILEECRLRMLRRVDLVRTDVSEGHNASIINLFNPMMEAITSILTTTTRRHMPEDSIL